VGRESILFLGRKGGGRGVVKRRNPNKRKSKRGNATQRNATQSKERERKHKPVYTLIASASIIAESVFSSGLNRCFKCAGTTLGATVAGPNATTPLIFCGCPDALIFSASASAMVPPADWPMVYSLEGEAWRVGALS